MKHEVQRRSKNAPPAHVCTQLRGVGVKNEQPSVRRGLPELGIQHGYPPEGTRRAGCGRCSWFTGLMAVCGALFWFNWQPLHACECNGANGEY